MYDATLIEIDTLKQAVRDVQKHFAGAEPFGAFVLGSGWGDAIKIFNVKKEISYSEITGFGQVGVSGHAGTLSLVDFNGKDFLVFQGRRHYYEGEGWTPVVLPAYIAKHCGAKLFFVSNASGGISYCPGDLMVITDHVNMMGDNPLRGRHHEELGERFPDMSSTYNQELIDTMMAAARTVDVELVKGVYGAFSGPAFETPAEIKLAKLVGADAVGMSTVPEVIVANAMGLKVAGIACITNYGAGITDNALSAQEVFDTIESVMHKIHKLLPEIIKAFSEIK